LIIAYDGNNCKDMMDRYDTNIMTNEEKYMNMFDGSEPIDYTKINDNLIERIAKALLMKYVLVVEFDGKEKEFRICEIEFYINNATHRDEYTHGGVVQKTYGKWYFHRFHGKSYKSGTYKGLDLTLGDKDTFFGVLIRSICDTDSGEFIEGPCRSVNKILELNGMADVKGYMVGRTDPLNARSTKNFHLKRKSTLGCEQIYKGPRIGLSDKYPEWKDVNYRFLIKKEMIKKGKSGFVEL
jgi:3-methyladenine DNA glycosylase Mpg